MVMLPARYADALRLFGRGRLIKQIGGELGIADITVKTHLRAGRELLGASDNRQAADILIRHERGEYIEGICTPRSIAEPSSAAPDLGSQIGHSTPGSAQLPLLREERAVFDLDDAPVRSRVWRSYVLRSPGQLDNDLTPRERLGATLGLTAILTVGGAIVLIAAMLLTLFLVQASNSPI